MRGLPARAAALLVLGAFAALAATAGERPLRGAGSPLGRPEFDWPTGGRDPFEFRPFRKKPGKRPLPPRPPVDKGIGKGKGKEPPVPKHLRPIAERAREAEVSLAQRQYSEAAKLAAEALGRIEPGLDPEGRLIERLRRLRDTARRLDERANIEKRFSELEIKIGGIVWEPGNAVALINGNVRRAGDIVEGVKIAEIRRREVIFVLEKGVRVRRQPLGAGAD